MVETLIIVGRDPWAAGRSAERAGYRPILVTCDGPRRPGPGHSAPSVVRVEPSDFPGQALKVLGDLPAGPLMIGGDVENHPEVIQAMAFDRTLLGTSLASIRAARDPRSLATLAPIPGLAYCETITSLSILGRLRRRVLGVFSRRRYLSKPLAGYAGREIEPWTPGQALEPGRYLQQQIRGTPISASYHADGWSATLLGVTEQLVGEAMLHAWPFTWCGSIGPMSLSEPARRALMNLGVALTQRYDLRGLFGVDAVMDHGGTIWPIEINPRYPESVEILERATGVVALAEARHVAVPRGKSHGGPACHAKVVLFAPADMNAADALAGLPAEQLYDAAEPDRPLQRGERLATLIVSGAGREDCVAKIQQQLKR